MIGRHDPRRPRTGPTTALAAVRDGIVHCALCPRLRTYCAAVAVTKKAAHRAEVYWGRPVPGFGDPAARVLVLGLAPAAHGASFDLGKGLPRLVASYHPSRQNTNTGKLTPPMLEAVFRRARTLARSKSRSR